MEYQVNIRKNPNQWGRIRQYIAMLDLKDLALVIKFLKEKNQKAHTKFEKQT